MLALELADASLGDFGALVGFARLCNKLGITDLRGLRAALRVLEITRVAPRLGIAIGCAAQRLGDILRHRLGHRVGGTRAIVGVLGARHGLGELALRAGELVTRLLALLARRRELGLGPADLDEPLVEIVGARALRRDLRFEPADCRFEAQLDGIDFGLRR